MFTDTRLHDRRRLRVIGVGAAAALGLSACSVTSDIPPQISSLTPTPSASSSVSPDAAARDSILRATPAANDIQAALTKACDKLFSEFTAGRAAQSPDTGDSEFITVSQRRSAATVITASFVRSAGSTADQPVRRGNCVAADVFRFSDKAVAADYAKTLILNSEAPFDQVAVSSVNNDFHFSSTDGLPGGPAISTLDVDLDFGNGVTGAKPSIDENPYMVMKTNLAGLGRAVA